MKILQVKKRRRQATYRKVLKAQPIIGNSRSLDVEATLSRTLIVKQQCSACFGMGTCVVDWLSDFRTISAIGGYRVTRYDMCCDKYGRLVAM